MPYADNLNIVGCCKDAVQSTKHKIVKHLESLGFRIHEEQEALTTAESLGFFIDGERGKVFPKPDKLQKVRQVLLWLAKCPRVSGKMVERIIGHCVHFCMLRRELLSIFRAVYDFKVVSYNKRQRLWKTAGHEFLCMASLLDLCFADLRRPWSSKVSASDASLTGTAVCSTTWSKEHVQQVGQQRELWRFRAIGGAGRARDHVQGLDPFVHPETAKPIDDSTAHPQILDIFQLNLDFQEVPSNLLKPDDWSVEFAARMSMPEHITLLEGRGVVQALRHKARSSEHFGARHVHLNDNLGMTLAFDRGRAKNKALLFQCRRSAAHALAMNCEFHFRWVPSELNVADKPSRIFESHSHASKRGAKKTRYEILYPGSKERADSTRCKTGLCGESLEEVHSALQRVVKDAKSCRSKKEDCRQDRNWPQREAKATHGRAPLSAPTTWPNFSGAICNFSENCCRLQVQDGGVQKVLPSSLDLHHRAQKPRSQLDNIPAAMLQRWDGAGRGNAVSGSCDRQLPRGGSKTQAATSTKSIEGLEESGSRAKSSSLALASDSVDCANHARAGPYVQRHVGSDHVCDLFQAHRDIEATEERFSQLNVFGGNLDACLQPRGRVRDFKNGGSRREHLPGLSSLAMVGQSFGKDVKASSSHTAAVSSGIQQVSHSVERCSSKDRAAGKAFNPLPAASLRRQLGSVQEFPNAAGSQNAGTMGVRLLNEPIREKSSCGNRIRQSSQKCSTKMSQRSSVSSGQGPRHFGPMKHCRGYALELCCGSARFSRALGRLGWHVEPWDIQYGDSCDLTLDRHVCSILDRIKQGAIQFVHIGFPRSSWSLERRDGSHGPKPLRDNSQFLMGYPNLSQMARRKVLLGNALLRQSVRVIRACQKAGVPWCFESPVASRIWLTRHIKSEKHCHLQRADFCQYGVPWRGATYFLCCDSLSVTFKTCSGGRICSRSGHKHCLLHGNREGVSLTKLAEPYPSTLASTLACNVAKQTPKSG